MKKIFILLSITLVTTLYVVFQDSLPPRTPIKIAKKISKLKIPSNGEIKNFEENWNENGDGRLLIEIQFTKTEIDEIIGDSRRLQYKALPISEMGDGFIRNLVKEINDGVYKIDIDVKDPSSFELVVIDKTNNRLVIYVIVT